MCASAQTGHFNGGNLGACQEASIAKPVCLLHPEGATRNIVQAWQHGRTRFSISPRMVMRYSYLPNGNFLPNGNIH